MFTESEIDLLKKVLQEAGFNTRKLSIPSLEKLANEMDWFSGGYDDYIVAQQGDPE